MSNIDFQPNPQPSFRLVGDFPQAPSDAGASVKHAFDELLRLPIGSLSVECPALGVRILSGAFRRACVDAEYVRRVAFSNEQLVHVAFYIMVAVVQIALPSHNWTKRKSPTRSGRERIGAECLALDLLFL